LAKQNVAGTQQRLDQRSEVDTTLDVDRVQLAALADAVAQLAAVSAGYRLFAGRIDFHQQQHVGLAEHLHEVVVEVAGAAVAMGLIDHDKAPLRPATADCLDHCGDFARVMTVVVNQHHAAVLDR